MEHSNPPSTLGHPCTGVGVVGHLAAFAGGKHSSPAVGAMSGAGGDGMPPHAPGGHPPGAWDLTLLDRFGGPGSRVQPGKPDIKWLPGVGQLEEWRLDSTTRIVTASHLGVVIAGPWARRPFEPDCAFGELAIEKSPTVWFQAL